MLSSAPQPDTRETGNVAPERLDTNQQTTPLAYWSGRHWFNFTWIVREAKNITVTKSSGGGKGSSKNGASQSTVYRCDAAGVMNGIGPVDFLEAIRVNGKIVWSVAGGIERGVAHPEHTGDIVVPNVGTFRLHWGTETAAGDFILLNSIGEDHPFYRGFPILEAVKLQQSSGGSVANIEVLVERAPRFDGLPSDRTGEGGSPITAIAEYAENGLYGMGMTGVIKVSSAAAAAESLDEETQSITIDGVTRDVSLGRLSCFIADRSAFSNFLSSVLEHFDGWARRSGAQIELGRWTHNAIETDGLQELTHHDLTEDPKFASLGFDDPSVYTDAIVKGPDRDWDMQPSPQIGRNDVARRRLGEMRIKTYDRPFAITSYQKKLIANELAKFYAVPAGRDSISARREKCSDVRPGERFILNYSPTGKREVYRCTQRRDPARGGVVDLTIELERLLSPLTLITPNDPPPNPPQPPSPVAVAHARMVQIPPEWAGGPEPTVIPLASRPSKNTLGFKVWFSESDSTYDELATVTDFAIRGTVNLAAGSGDSTVTLNLSGFDIADLTEQSATEQADNSLLLFIGSEILSVGAVTALGAGVYELGVLRSRLGSAASAHDSGSEVFVLRREVAEQLRHAQFPRTASMRYFKLPGFTVDDEQELADALKITFAFADSGVGDPVPVSVVGGVGVITLALTMPTVAADLATLEIWERASVSPAPVDGDAPNFFDVPPTAPGGMMTYARTGFGASVTRYYWARLRDTIAGKSGIVYLGTATTSATVAERDYVDELIDQVARDIAQFTANANDQAAGLIRELTQRGEAIVAEQTERRTNEEAFARDLAGLLAVFNDQSAALVREFTVRATETSANASAITALSSVVGDNYSTLSSTLETVADETSALTTAVLTLNAAVGDIEATTNVLAAAYVVDGEAVAFAGWQLDVDNKVTSLVLMSSSGPVTLSELVLAGANMRSDNFAESGGAPTAGWKLGYDGVIRAKGAIFRDADIVGTLRVGTIIEEGVTIPVASAAAPSVTRLDSSTVEIDAPSSPPSGYAVQYSIDGDPASAPQSSFPFSLPLTSGQELVYWATAPGYTQSAAGIFYDGP